MINNICNKWCLLSSVLIMGSIFICCFPHRNKILKDFMNILDEKQKGEYVKIIKMRRDIYLRSLVSAVVLSIILCFIGLRKKSFSINNVCIFLALVFSFKNLFYILSKKSSYIVTKLNNEKQRNAWLNIYKNMQWHYHLGILVGLVGVIIISISYCGKL